MRMFKIGMPALLVASAAILSGCGGSDSDNTVETSFLTYYNLSSNVLEADLYRDDILLTTVNYQSISSTTELTAGDTDIKLCYGVDNAVDDCPYDETLNLPKDKYNILISQNDFEVGSEKPLFFSFDSSILENNKAAFNVVHVAEQCQQDSTCSGDLDIVFYNSNNTETNRQTLSYNEQATIVVDANVYDVAIENNGVELIRTDGTSLISNTRARNRYFAITDVNISTTAIRKLALRDLRSTGGTLNAIPRAEVIVTDVDEISAFLRVYNSVDSLGVFSLTNANTGEDIVANQQSDDLPSDKVGLSAGTYKLDLTGSMNGFSGLSQTFEQNYNGTLFIYRNDSDVIIPLSVDNSARDGDFSNHYITVVNLLNETLLSNYPSLNNKVQDIEVLISVADQLSSSQPVRFPTGQFATFTRDSGRYDITIQIPIGSNGNGTVTQIMGQLLDQSFGNGDSDLSGDYFLVIEPADDGNASSTDIKLTLLEM